MNSDVLQRAAFRAVAVLVLAFGAQSAAAAPPTAVDDLLLVNVGDSSIRIFRLLDNDVAGTEPFNLCAIDFTSIGTLACNPDAVTCLAGPEGVDQGVFGYLAGGAAGLDSFSYRAGNAPAAYSATFCTTETSNTATVNIIVNRPPVLAVNALVLDLDAGPRALELNDFWSDPDAGLAEFTDVLSFTGGVSPAPAVFTATLVGTTLTVTPVGSGEASVPITATDNRGTFGGPGIFNYVTNSSTSGAISIRINTTPFVVTPIGDRTILEDALPLVISLAGVFDDADAGDVLSFTITSNTNPALFDSVSIIGSELTIDPGQDRNGVSDFMIRATDSNGRFVEDAFTLTITPVNDPPEVFVPVPAQTFDEDDPAFTVSLATLFTDVDIETNGDTLVLSIAGNSNPGLLRTPLLSGVTGAISNTTLTLHGAPDQNGVTTLTIRATDSAGATADFDILVTVNPQNDPPFVDQGISDVVMDEDTTRVVDVSSAFDDVDIVTNADALALSVIANDNAALFDDLSITAFSLSIVPVANGFGVANVTVQARDLAGETAETSFRITVTQVDDPPTAVDDVAATDQDVPVTIFPLVNDSEVDGGVLEILSATAANAGATVEIIGGTSVRYTPAPLFFGVDTIEYTITDGVGPLTDSATITVTVTNVDDPPVAVDDAVTMDEDTTLIGYSPLGNDSSVDGGTLSITAATVDTGTVTLSGGGTTLDYTPEPNFFGTALISYTIRDSFGPSTATATITVTVTNLDDPPVAVDDAVTMDEDTTLIGYSPLGNDSSVDGGALIITAATVDTGTVTITGGGTTLDYTPEPNFFGTALINYTIRDSFGPSTASATITVTVNPVNDVPIANDDAITILEDAGPVIINVLANDFLFDAPVGIISAGTTLIIDGVEYAGSSESAPTTVIDNSGDPITRPNGAVEVLPDGTIRYQAKDNFNGSDFFTYTIEDVDGDRDTGRVDITIVPVNDPPTATDQSFTVQENLVLGIVPPGLLQTAFDVDGDPLTAILQNPASFGIVTVESNGSFIYQPDVNFVGTDTFTFFVSDGTTTNVGGARTVTIQVTEAPPPPPPPPAGEVEFDFQLAQVPLELAVGVEPNVLIVMDDSGSMDWSILTAEPEGRFRLTNRNFTTSTGNDDTLFSYVFGSPTNTFTQGNVNGRVLPSEEALGFSVFNGNRFGVWRGRNHQYNKIYYNPQVRYRPWRGLNPDNEPFPDVDPMNAPWDPMRPTGINSTVNLTANHSYTATRVPGTFSNIYNINISNYYIPRYYTTTVEGEPAWNDPHTRVEIRPDPVPNPNPGPPFVAPVFAGGPDRIDCAQGDNNPLTCSYTQEIQNFANWFTYYRLREYTVKNSLGRVVADSSSIRIGYASLNNDNERIRIAEMNSSVRAGNKRDLLDQIYRIRSVGGTPLRRALDRAGRHFECRSGDSFGSSSDTSPGSTSCPVEPAPAGQCQQNFTLLFTDGTWNGPTPSTIGNRDGDNNSGFDGGIFADTRSDTLADVAMNYYERDLHPSLDNRVPTSARDRNLAPDSAFTDNGTRMHQQMTTYTVGFGVAGLIEPENIPGDFTSTVPWGDPFSDNLAKIDDLLHAALNGRGDYLSAADSVALDEELTRAFDEFSSGQGAASAVAFNSQQLREDTLVFRGFYNTKENTGDLVAQLIDDATDQLIEPPEWSAADQLDLKNPNDRVIVTWDDIAERGIPFRFGDLNAPQRSQLDADMVGYLRGDRSNERPLGRNFRERPLSGGLIGDIVNSTPVFVGPPSFIQRDSVSYPIANGDLYSAFRDDNATRSGVVYVGANDGMLHAFDSETGDEVFAFVPDKLISGSRFANELFQFTSPAYGHKFFADGTPAINDVFIDVNGGTARDWRTVLVGSLRAGGKGYYAIDITDPSAFGDEDDAADRVLWEFDDRDDLYPTNPDGTPVGGGTLTDLAGAPIKDLGYSFSVPTIAMTNVDGVGSGTRSGSGANSGIPSPEKKWAAVFGNGYNSTHGVAKLFVAFIEDGADGSWDTGDVIKVDTGFGVPPEGEQNAGLPNGLGIPRLIDLDGDGTADYAYAGDLLGNLFRFDLTDSNPANWSATRIYKAVYTDGTQQPITTQPIVTRNPQADGVVVIFATGSFITEPDGTSEEIQSVYGIWDRFESTPPAASGGRSFVVEQEIINLQDPVIGALRTLSSNPVEYLVAGATRGWVVDLDAPRPTMTTTGGLNPDMAGNAPPAPQFPGERAVRNLQLRGGFLFVNTVIPRSGSSCEQSPGGFALAFNPITGGAGGQLADNVFDLNNDGEFTDADMVDGNIVGGLRFDDAVPTDSAFIGSKRFTQLSDRTVDIRETNTGVGSRSGRLSWRELQ